MSSFSLLPVPVPTFSAWRTEPSKRFLPVLQHLAAESGLKTPPEQRPAEPPAFFHETG